MSNSKRCSMPPSTSEARGTLEVERTTSEVKQLVTVSLRDLAAIKARIEGLLLTLRLPTLEEADAAEADWRTLSYEGHLIGVLLLILFHLEEASTLANDHFRFSPSNFSNWNGFDSEQVVRAVVGQVRSRRPPSCPHPEAEDAS